VDLLWEYSGEYLQACLTSDLTIAVVPVLQEGLNRLFDGFNR